MGIIFLNNIILNKEINMIDKIIIILIYLNVSVDFVSRSNLIINVSFFLKQHSQIDDSIWKIVNIPTLIYLLYNAFLFNKYKPLYNLDLNLFTWLGA